MAARIVSFMTLLLLGVRIFTNEILLIICYMSSQLLHFRVIRMFACTCFFCFLRRDALTNDGVTDMHVTDVPVFFGFVRSPPSNPMGRG